MIANPPTSQIFKKQGVCHTVTLPFTLKKILRQKKNYEISNISPCKNIIFKKTPLKLTKILQDIIITNLKFQKSSYKNRPIIYYLGAKIP
jgi:hypothetical protein